VVISLALDVVSIAVSLAVKSFVAPLLAQSLGGGGDQRPGAALVVYATLNTGFLALNALSLDAACSDAGARWVFGEGLLAHLLSWSLFGAYASYAVHLLRHGGMVLLGVPAERATAFALLLLLPEVAGVLMLDLGPGPLLVLVDLVGA
jgi:hypothetical protein